MDKVKTIIESLLSKEVDKTKIKKLEKCLEIIYKEMSEETNHCIIEIHSSKINSKRGFAYSLLNALRLRLY